MVSASKVICIRSEEYGNLLPSIERLFQILQESGYDIDSDYSFKKKVLLKPNLCEPFPKEKAATTHPDIIDAVIRYLKKRECSVMVGEQSASNTPGVTKKAVVKSGLLDVLRKTNTPFYNMQEHGFIAKKISDNLVLEQTDFSSIIFLSDSIINLPKFKTHGITCITGAIKNMFGVLHPFEKNYMHKKYPDKVEFAKSVLDIYKITKPTLSIMDCIVCMEGDEGPSYGKPRKVGYILAGTDAVAVDAVAAKMTGHDPLKIPLLKIAHDNGIGCADIDNIELLGDELKVVEDFDRSTSYESPELIEIPVINERCVSCGECYNKCPVKAIKQLDGKYMINSSKCIDCRCCLEVCVYEGVSIIRYEPEKNHTCQAREKKSDCKHASKGCNRTSFKVGGKDSGKVANIRLGLECNHDCLFCTVGDSDEKTFSLKEVKERFLELESEGVDAICLTGGEPAIREDFIDIIKEASKKFKVIEVQTNGVKFADSTFLKKVINAGASKFLVSIHSHEEDVSNELTASKDFDKTIEGIKNLVAQGVNVSISCVINNSNVDSLIEYVDYFNKISNRIHFYFGFIRPNGTTQKNKSLVPKLHMVEVQLKELMDYCDQNKISFSVEGIPFCYMLDHLDKSHDLKRKQKGNAMYTNKDDKVMDFHKNINDNLKVKSPECEKCNLNPYCPGIWKEYAEMNGTDELYPIFEELDDLLKNKK